MANRKAELTLDECVNWLKFSNRRFADGRRQRERNEELSKQLMQALGVNPGQEPVHAFQTHHIWGTHRQLQADYDQLIERYARLRKRYDRLKVECRKLREECETDGQ